MREPRQRPYVARMGRLSLDPDQQDFLNRRTRPFLDTYGLERPLLSLLQEAYLQGIRDTLEVLEIGHQ